MSLYVLDASVAVKWFVQETHSADARRVLASADDLVSPAFTPNEVGSAFLKKIRRGEMRREIALAAIPHVVERIRLENTSDMVEPALTFALEHDRSIFDSFYVLLALREGCRLVTADERLYNGLRTRFSEHLMWLEEFPA